MGADDGTRVGSDGCAVGDAEGAAFVGVAGRAAARRDFAAAEGFASAIGFTPAIGFVAVGRFGTEGRVAAAGCAAGRVEDRAEERGAGRDAGAGGLAPVAIVAGSASSARCASRPSGVGAVARGEAIGAVDVEGGCGFARRRSGVALLFAGREWVDWDD